MSNPARMAGQKDGWIYDNSHLGHLLAQERLYRRLWDLQNLILLFGQALETHPGFAQICKLSPKNAKQACTDNSNML
jgi:hypothetical protein